MDPVTTTLAQQLALRAMKRRFDYHDGPVETPGSLVLQRSRPGWRNRLALVLLGLAMRLEPELREQARLAARA